MGLDLLIIFSTLKFCRALVVALAVVVVVALAVVEVLVAMALAQPLPQWSELPPSLDVMFPFV